MQPFWQHRELHDVLTMWKCLQVTVATGFLFANIRFQWLDNPFVASVNAGFAAMFATWLVSKSMDLFRRRRQLRSGHQSRDNRGYPRVGRR